MEVVNDFSELPRACQSEVGLNVSFQTIWESQSGVEFAGLEAGPLTMFNMSPTFRTVKTINGYKFTMYWNEGRKPHVHVEKSNKYAEFWLTPTISVKSNGTMKEHERTKAIKAIEPNRQTFMRQFEENKKKVSGG